MEEKSPINSIKKRLYALLFYALFWLVFFITARLFFIFTHFKEAFQFSFGELARTFWYGSKLDFSAIGYLFLLPVLFLLPTLFFNGKWYRIFLRWYSFIFIGISSIIIVSDTLLYKYWGFRMDMTPLLYLKTPKEAAASVTSLQLAEVILGVLVFSAIFIYLYRKFIDEMFDGFERINRIFFTIPASLFLLILWGSLLIPIRGGFGIAPINAGTVYFSEEMFLNHTAINVAWNVGSSVINQKPSKNPYQFGDIEKQRKLLDSLIFKSDPPVKIINNTRPNIIFLVIESFGSPMVGALGGDSLTTPCFNRYIKEGVLFKHFYASGNRTDKAMPAIINGYPAQPAVSIMKEPKKTQSLPGIVKTLNRLGYNSSFWYGGDINFANFHSFVINSGFKQIITENDFNPEYYNSKWGVHDHILFNTLIDSMKSVREPFFKVVLTLSSHEPFEIPVKPVFGGDDEITKFKNSIYYVDKAVGSFLDWAKGTAWWKNTLVVITGDHYRRNSEEVLVYADDIFEIPMLWVGGALSERGIEVSKIGSQVDIPLTILHQIDLDDNYPFSKDLLSAGSNSFAFYAFNEGFGFITDSSKYIYDHKPGKPVVESGAGSEYAGKLGKAYLQVLYDDFLKR